jgi:hypothetical protein
MRITFTDMSHGPGRDVEAYCAAEAIDDSGTRYAVRLMIESEALLGFKEDIKRSLDEVIKALYVQEIERLHQARELKPQNPSTNLVVIFFADGDESPQALESDIVVRNTSEKLRSIAKRLGHALR